MSPCVVDLIEYLTDLFHKGKAYRTINVHRSMISSTAHVHGAEPLGQHKLVTALMKSIFNRRPPQPKYTHTWSPDKVTDFLRNLGPNEALTIEWLSRKVVTLVALATMLRTSELASIKCASVHISETMAHATLLRPRKSQRSGPLRSVSIRSSSDALICPVQALTSYLARTEAVRPVNGTTELFLTTLPPQRAATANTLARWIKYVLREAGINTSVFSAHSTRGAAASHALRSGVPLASILQAADWRSQRTFNEFYRRDIAESQINNE